MANIKELLADVARLQRMAELRVKEWFAATGGNCEVSPASIEFSETKVTITLQEATNHDCPDYWWFQLTAHELSMDDEAWKMHLSGIKDRYEQFEIARIEREADRNKAGLNRRIGIDMRV